jgi:choline dehydrogenase-like flavoprotein
MLQDFRSYQDNAQIETQICIIGAGAAGITIAQEFLGTNQEVIVVESGDINPKPAVDALIQGESVGIPYNGFTSEARSRVLGGTTRLWYGQCIPLDDIDFETRPWVAHSGWPITKADLNPYYRRAEVFLNIPGAHYDERIWRQFNLQPPEIDRNNLSYKPTVWCPQTDLGKAYYHKFLKSKNITVLLHANMVKLHSNPTQSTVESLEIRTLDGKKGVIRAKAFILCCGGIENARLLLLSNGLGNGHDLVGRFFQEHLNACCGVVQTESPLRLQDCFALLYKNKIRYLPKIRLAADVQSQRQVLNCTSNLVFQFPENSAEAAARNIYLLLKTGKILKKHKQLTQDARTVLLSVNSIVSLLYRRYALGRSTGGLPSSIWLQTHAEQAPNPESRITLSDRSDVLGLKIAQIDWRLTDLDRRTAEVMIETLQAGWSKFNQAHVSPVDWLTDTHSNWTTKFSTSSHHIGTTRMADSPQSGVVNSNCQVHGVANLFIAGSSVFPTGGYANPTLTIVALAIRLSDYLKKLSV